MTKRNWKNKRENKKNKKIINWKTWKRNIKDSHDRKFWLKNNSNPNSRFNFFQILQASQGVEKLTPDYSNKQIRLIYFKKL